PPPAVPGIADANSKPPRPALRARWSETAFGAPPPAMRRSPSARTAARPPASLRTSASTPSSCTSMFEPSPTTSTAIARCRAQRTASTRSSIVSTCANQPAGPPVPIVVKRESATPSSTRATLAAKQVDGPVDVACAEHDQHVPGPRVPLQPLRALLDRRRPPRQHAQVAERVDDQLAGDAGHGLLAGRVDVGDGDVVRGRKRAPELPRQVARPRIEVRLEEHSHRCVRPLLADRPDRLGDLGRMVAVVVDKEAIAEVVDFEPARRAGEARERELGVRTRHARDAESRE